MPGIVESPFGEGVVKRVKKETKEPLSRRAQMRKKEETTMVTYGAKKGDKALAMTAKHTSALAPVVNELASLEREIQQLFGSTMWGLHGDKAVAAPKPQRPRATAKPAARAPAAAPAAAPAPQEPVKMDTEEPAVKMEVDQEDKKRVATGWASGGGKPKRKARW